MDRVQWRRRVVESDLSRRAKMEMLDAYDALGEGLPFWATDGLGEAIDEGWLELVDGRWRPALPGGDVREPRTIAYEPAKAARQVRVDELCDGCPLLEWAGECEC